MLRMLSAFLLGFALLAGPSVVGAQVVRGVALDAAGQPIPGVVVALLDSAGAVRVRALSDAAGAFSIRAPTAGMYRLRALRIGFQPVDSRVLSVAAGAVVDERFVLDGARVALEAVRVIGQNSCGRSRAEELRTVYAAWDQAMTTVTATSLSGSRGMTATMLNIERTLDPSGRRIRSQRATARTAQVAQPWRSLPAAVLRTQGYSAVEADGATTYNAPGLEVLSATTFLEDHCLRLVAAADTTEIGVAFEPSGSRWRLPEIRGTLWMERETAILRRLDFTFTGVPDSPAVVDDIAGGSMVFTRLRTGAVVISRWEIRMPQLARESPRSTTVRMSEILSTGGELVLARIGNDTLYARAPLVVRGTVSEATSGAPVAGAVVSLTGVGGEAETDPDGRFAIPDVLPGAYTLSVRTASLDSIRATNETSVLVTDGMAEVRLSVPTALQLAASVCGQTLARASARGLGAVLGSVHDIGSGDGIAGVRVVADWTETSIGRGAGAISQRGRRLETRTDASGAFRLCMVPTETQLMLRALPDSGRTTLVSVRLAPDDRFASAQLTVERGSAATATLSGFVVADTADQPLADVEVVLPELGIGARSDARGAFRIEAVPAGRHRVVARRIGFGALETEVVFAPNEEEERRIVLARMTVLEEVSVYGRAADEALRDFAESRRLGLGKFVGREELERIEGRKMSEVVGRLAGVGVTGLGTRAFLLSRRQMLPLSALEACAGGGSPGGSVYVPSTSEKRQGVACACYAQVYLDGVLQNPGIPSEPFDVNSIPPGKIEAIEWYASPAETPARYAGLNSACGVYVIHSRRPTGSARTADRPRGSAPR